MAAHIGTLQNSRLRTMVVPREHGAWGMMLVPLATGAVVGAHGGTHLGPLMLFVSAAVSLFWLRTPLEAWLGTSSIKAQSATELATVRKVSMTLAALALGSVATLLYASDTGGWLIIGGIAGLAFVGQVVAKQVGRRGRMPAQIIGAIGLTSTAAGAYYATAGRLDCAAVTLWLANWIFAADQIYYVQLRIRNSRLDRVRDKLRVGRGFFAGQAILIVALLVSYTLRVTSLLGILAFLPALARGTFWFLQHKQPLDVHRLGFTELAQAIIFGLLLSAAFHV